MSIDLAREKPVPIQNFVAAYGAVAFEHAAEIIPLMQRNDPAESRISRGKATLDQLRVTARNRAAHFAWWWRRIGVPRPFIRDTRAVAAQLAGAKDQRVWAWYLGLTDGTTYEWYELRADTRIIGAVKNTALRRRVLVRDDAA